MGIRLPRIQLPEIRLDNPIGSFTNTVSFLLDPFDITGTLSTPPGGRDPLDRFGERREQARADALKNALADKDLDSATRQEIEALYTNRGSPEDITKLLMASKEGKGVYFGRRNNDLRQKERADAPGRSQTVLSLNNSTVLGGGRGY